MRKHQIKFVFPLIVLSVFFFQLHQSFAQQSFIPPQNKILVVSGGGARGAWGVGVVSELYKQRGGYKAVFGTSTGSLMTPFILLQKFDALEQIYSNVTQSDIFNKNPFNVTCDCANFTTSANIKVLMAIFRFIFGKKTFGESKNLLKLIHNKFSIDDYNLLIDYFNKYHVVLAVAVTNTRTGNLEIKTDSGYSKTKEDYEKLCRWIWASANEPLLMSYVKMDSSYYVDGGVREVIPIQNALKYAISNKDIDTVEVIVNNSKVPGSQNWNRNNGGIFNGLQRLLDMYDMGTVAYNREYAELLTKYYDAIGTVQGPGDTSSGPSRKIHLRIHYMEDSIAAKYSNDLGFCNCCMLELIRLGKIYANTPEKPNRYDRDFDEKSIRAFQKKD